MSLLTPTQKAVDYLLGFLGGLYLITRDNPENFLPDFLAIDYNKLFILLLSTYLGGIITLPWLIWCKKSS